MTAQPAELASERSFFQRLSPAFKTVALVVTIVGAIPTAVTAYHAWQYKVPFSQVPHRLAQYDLWVKNIDCPIDYKALATDQGTHVDVGACPKSGDIAIKISSADGKSTYEWIAFNQLQQPGEQRDPTMLELLIGTARAASLGEPGRIRVAGGMQVVCQAVSGKNIVRIVNDGGKCFREVVSPMSNAMSRREEVPCDTRCK